jgi:polyphosphate kinase 2 (PPK2 family)
MSAKIDTSQFRYVPGTRLRGYPTSWQNLENAADDVANSVERLTDLQELLWADNRYAVLLVFQGMDTAGKDGTIKRDIAAMERHLWRNGTLIVKFFLHLSKEEQKKRLTNHEKLWKFDPGDLDEREHWDDYQHAYQDALEHTDDDHAPWFVIPADDKWTMRALVARVLVDQIGRLDLAYPKAAEIDDQWVEQALKRLRNEEA